MDAATRDPRDPQGGITAAVAEANAMLAIDGVVGVNLSGSASRDSEIESADLMAELGRRLRSKDEKVRA